MPKNLQLWLTVQQMTRHSDQWQITLKTLKDYLRVRCTTHCSVNLKSLPWYTLSPYFALQSSATGHFDFVFPFACSRDLEPTIMMMMTRSLSDPLLLPAAAHQSYSYIAHLARRRKLLWSSTCLLLCAAGSGPSLAQWCGHYRADPSWHIYQNNLQNAIQLIVRKGATVFFSETRLSVSVGCGYIEARKAHNHFLLIKSFSNLHFSSTSAKIDLSLMVFVFGWY